MEYIPAKTILKRNKRPEFWFGHDYNMNIYKGCSHGCIYCDSRSSCYGVEDFDRVRCKQDVLTLIEHELRSKQYKGVVGMGAMSDPYNPYEREHQLTRQALMLLDRYGFGVGLSSKSALIMRDIELIKSINRHSPVCIKMTITTADDELSSIVEPHVDVTSKRYQALKAVADAGIYTGILMMPILPFINDTKENIKSIVIRAKEAGVNFIYPSFGVTLRQNQRLYFYEKLDKHFPGIKEQYIRHYRYNYNCISTRYQELMGYFRKCCKCYGLDYKMSEIVKNSKNQLGQTQLSLF